MLLYIAPPVTLLEGTEQSNQNFYTCVNFQAGSMLLSILILSDFKFVISRKKSKDSLNPGTSNILCCGIGLLGLSHTLFTLSINTLLCLSVFRTLSVESAQCVQIATPQLLRFGGETGRVSLFATRADYIISCMA